MNVIFAVLFFSLSWTYLPLLNFPSVTPKWISWGILSVILLFFVKNKDKVSISKETLYFFLFFVWQVLSIFWAKSKIASVNSILYIVILLVSYFPLLYFVRKRTDIFRILAYYFAISSTVISIIGTLQYFGLIGNLFNQVAPPAAMFVNKNFASPFSIFAFWWSFLYFLKSKKKIFIPVISLNLFFNIISATRSVWVATIFTIILFSLLCLSNKKVVLNFKGIAAVMVILLTLIFVTRFKPANVRIQKDYQKQIGDIIKVNSSAKVRLNRWKNSLAIISSKPIAGYGLNNFDVVYPKFHNAKVKDEYYTAKYFFGGVHNEYLQILSETGIIGLLLFAILLFSYFRMLSSVEEIFLRYSLLLSTVSILITSFFSSTLHYPTYLFLFMLNFIIAVTKSQNRVLKLPLKSLKIIYLFIFIVYTYLFYNIFQTDRFLKKANAEFYKGYISYAFLYSKKAISYWKYDTYLLYNASNYGFTLFLYDKKNLNELLKINDLTLKALPYHFLPNYSKGLLLYSVGTKKEIKNYLTQKNELLEIAPENRKSDARKLIKMLELKI